MNKPEEATSKEEESDGPADAVLVGRSQSGDMAAFDALVTRYRGKVYAMIVNMVRNDADAWDLSQDVFVKAWKALPKFEARSSFFTWIYRITYNVTCDFVRRRKITASGEFDETIRLDAMESAAPTAPRPIDTPAERLAGSELGAEIAAALDQLSADHRAAIIMREIDGMKYEEIAEAMGCSTGTVMSRLFYARKKLQELLSEVRKEIR